MKNTLRRFLTALLAVLLLLSVSVGAFADFDREHPFTYYFCMGDSIPGKRSGDMSEFAGGYNNWLEKSYPMLVAEKYGLTDAAARYYGSHTGWRTNEVRWLLDDAYAGDEYTNNAAWLAEWGGYSLELMETLREPYREALSRADLITINLGNNDIVGELAYAIAETLTFHTAGTPCEKAALAAIAAAKEKATACEALFTLLTFIETLENGAVLVESFVAAFAESMKSFPADWDALMAAVENYVRSDAIIVVVGLYNCFDSVVKTNAEQLAVLAPLLQKLTDPVVETMNRYISTGSPYAASYSYVDVTGVDLTGSGDGCHLGQAGHRYFADGIIAAINAVLPCAHDGETTLENFREAEPFRPGYSGDTRCSVCDRVIEKGHTTYWQCKHEHTTVIGAIKPTRYTPGSTGNTVCTDCGKLLSVGRVIKYECTHSSSPITVGARAATKYTKGYTGDTVCPDCGKVLKRGEAIAYVCKHETTKLVGEIKPTLFTAGYSGNTVCADCGRIMQLGKVLKAKFFR